PEEPPNLESSQRTERVACVDIRSAGAAESTGDFREGERDESHDQRAHQVRDETVRAGERERAARQPEDAGADDAIQDERNEIPATDAPNESGTGVRRDQDFGAPASCARMRPSESRRLSASFASFTASRNGFASAFCHMSATNEYASTARSRSPNFSARP